MSSNKRLCLRDNSQNRDSFDERICDDLSEVILQFLPLKARLKLECVSKQFQRSVIASQKDLMFDSKGNLMICITEYRKYSNKYQKIKKLNKLESLLKKFPNIESVRYEEGDPEQELNEELYNKKIELIIRYCNHLSYFYNSFQWISARNQMNFFKKFGSKVVLDNTVVTEISKELYVIKDQELRIKLMINDSQLNPKINKIQFKRLDALLMICLSEEDLDPFEVFIERNKSLIKDLKIEFLECEDEDKFKRLLSIVSKLTNLVHLGIIPGLALNYKIFAKELTQIAVNCSQLKSLNCSLVMSREDGPINDNLLSSLKQFESLKCLDQRWAIPYSNPFFLIVDNNYEELPTFGLDFHFYHHKSEFNQSLTDYFNSFSLKAFKGFEGLTHLGIYWPLGYKEVANETILIDIDINLPNLQFFKLLHGLNATEWTANILSRLSKLQTIKLCVKKSVQPIIKTKLENCTKIENIEFESYFWEEWVSNEDN